jgi:hypothetical protein
MRYGQKLHNQTQNLWGTTMLSSIKRFFVIALCLNFTACTTLNTVGDRRKSDSSSQNKSGAGLVLGEKVVVTTTSNERIDLLVTANEPTAIVGTERGSSQIRRIPTNEVLRVQRAEVSVLGVSAVILLACTAIAMVALSQAAFFPAAP